MLMGSRLDSTLMILVKRISLNSTNQPYEQITSKSFIASNNGSYRLTLNTEDRPGTYNITASVGEKEGESTVWMTRWDRVSLRPTCGLRYLGLA